MNYFAGMTDVAMTIDGDLRINDNGDLELIDGFDNLSVQTNKRVRTNNPTWRKHPTSGASLHDFIGMPNTRETSSEIMKRILNTLNVDGIAYPGRFSVQIVPVDVDTLIITIYFDLAGSRSEISKLLYNFTDGLVQRIEDRDIVYTAVPQEKKLVDKRVNVTKTPNMYQERIRNQTV